MNLGGAMLTLVAALLLPACAGQVEPLPSGCRVESEKVRLQVCPHQSAAVICSDVAQTNPMPGHCDGPDWTEGRQVTGNVWCCD